MKPRRLRWRAPASPVRFATSPAALSTSGHAPSRFHNVSSRQRALSVVLLSEPAGGGVGQHVLDLAEGLTDRGHDVLLVHGTARMAHGFGERLAAARFSAVGVSHLGRSPHPRDAIASLSIARAIRAHGARTGRRPDILHAHSTKAGLLARTILRPLSPTCLYTPHALYTLRPDLSARARAFVGALELSLAHTTSRVVAVSQDEAEHAVNLGISPHRVVCVENGIALTSPNVVTARRLAARTRLGLEPGTTVIGFVGRLSHQKNPELALRVLSHVTASHPNTVGIIVGDEGDASLRDALRAAPARVRWLPDARGVDLVPAFDVLLCTSRYEGFPYVFLEALDAGCAIVTTPVGGARDCVLPNVTGLIVPEDGLVAATRTLAANRSLLENLQAGARSHATRFSLERMLDRLEDLYYAHTPSATTGGGSSAHNAIPSLPFTRATVRSLP